MTDHPTPPPAAQTCPDCSGSGVGGTRRHGPEPEQWEALRCERCDGEGRIAPPAAQTREPGVYWLKGKADDWWFAGEWSEDGWLVPGDTLRYRDADFGAVGPYIPTPAERAGDAALVERLRATIHELCCEWDNLANMEEDGTEIAPLYSWLAERVAEHVGTILAALARAQASAPGEREADGLRPCPFCQQSLVLSTMKTSAGETKHWAHRDPLHSKCYAARFMLDVDDEEEIAAWNTRTPSPEAAQGVEAKVRAREGGRAMTMPSDERLRELATKAENEAASWRRESQDYARAGDHTGTAICDAKAERYDGFAAACRAVIAARAAAAEFEQYRDNQLRGFEDATTNLDRERCNASWSAWGIAAKKLRAILGPATGGGDDAE